MATLLREANRVRWLAITTGDDRWHAAADLLMAMARRAK